MASIYKNQSNQKHDRQVNGNTMAKLALPRIKSSADFSCTQSKRSPLRRLPKNKYLWLTLLAGILLFLFLLPSGIRLVYTYETPIEPVDLILVDETGQSLQTAISLYRDGMVKRFLITEPLLERYKDSRTPVCAHQIIKQDLMDAGIPSTAIAGFENEEHTALEKQIALKKWIHAHNISSYMHLTQLYSTRYDKMIHDDTFPEGNIKLVLYPSNGKGVWRRQLLALHNTAIRVLYWKWFCQAELNEATHE
jgi:hypothetical protein